MSNGPKTEHALWRPAATIDVLKDRAVILDKIRAFFKSRGVLEVTTPALVSRVAPERHQTPPACGAGFLQTSPETAMKRLLCAGSGAIFQMGPAFRLGEFGALHNPEFTMLEWYRPGWSYRQLLVEVENLVGEILSSPPSVVLTFQEAFVRYVGVDPFLATIAELQAGLLESPPTSLDRPALVDLLVLQRLEPALRCLAHPVFLTHYPAWDPAMAQVDPGPPAVALRFELYVAGIELANGFQELTDPVEQQKRFARTNELRKTDGCQALPEDAYFLEALQEGMPSCAGVALGVDRLVMLALGAHQIAQVMTFPWDRV